MAISKLLYQHFIQEAISPKKYDALLAMATKMAIPNFKEQGNEEYIVDLAKRTFDKILALDPTPNNQYTQWLIQKGIPNSEYFAPYNQFRINERLFREDSDRISDAIKIHFEKKLSNDFKKENPQYVDINKVPSLQVLLDITRKYQFDYTEVDLDEIIKYKGIELGEDYKIVYDSPTVKLYIPLTEEGACTLGAKTEWCTTWGENSLNPSFKGRSNQFNYYNEDGNMIIIRIIEGENKESFYQIHPATMQTMDEHDRNTAFIYIVKEIHNLNEQAVIPLLKSIMSFEDSTRYTISNISVFKKYLPEDELHNVVDNAIQSVYRPSFEIFKQEGGKYIAMFGNWVDAYEHFARSSNYNETFYLGEDIYYDVSDSSYYDVKDWKDDGEETVEFLRKEVKNVYVENVEDVMDEDDEITEEYIDDASLTELLKMIDDIEVFSDIKSFIQYAISDLQDSADFDEGYRAGVDTILANMGLGSMDRENVYFDNNSKLVIELGDTVPDTVLAIYVSEDVEKTKVLLGFDTVSQPYYGFQGNIDWSNAYDVLFEKF
jgi:hypothetical protein